MTRHKERWCIAGHDTWICGRYTSRQCVECSRDYDRKRRSAFGQGLYPPRRLFSIVKRKAWSWEYVTNLYALRQQVTRDAAALAVRRLKESKGLTVDQADIWCLVLGTDLIVVYPEAYRLKGVVA
jgi:hypothetical protein